jgi:hypothetical protein
MLHLTHNTQHLALKSPAAVASYQQIDDLAALKAMIEENKVQLAEYQVGLSKMNDKLFVF